MPLKGRFLGGFPSSKSSWLLVSDDLLFHIWFLISCGMQPRYLMCSRDWLNLSAGLAGLAALVANWCDLSALRPLCERKEPNEVKTQIYELNFKRQRPIIWRIKKTIHNRIILSRLTKEKRLNSTTLSKQRQLMRKDVRRWVIFVFPIFVGNIFSENDLNIDHLLNQYSTSNYFFNTASVSYDVTGQRQSLCDGCVTIVSSYYN